MDHGPSKSGYFWRSRIGIGSPKDELLQTLAWDQHHGEHGPLDRQDRLFDRSISMHPGSWKLAEPDPWRGTCQTSVREPLCCPSLKRDSPKSFVRTEFLPIAFITSVAASGRRSLGGRSLGFHLASLCSRKPIAHPRIQGDAATRERDPRYRCTMDIVSHNISSLFLGSDNCMLCSNISFSTRNL